MVAVIAGCGSDTAVTKAASASPQAMQSATTTIKTVVSNAPQAVGITFDAKGRMLYAEKDSGRVIRVSGGKREVLATLQVYSGGETGLLGLAVDAKQNVYTSYTSGIKGCPNPTKKHTTADLSAHCVWRFKPTSTGGLRADGLVFSTDHPSTAYNHNGGGVHIGPADGALYLAIGDLGENDDTQKGPGRSQSVDLPYGKMLRLDPARTNKPAANNPLQCNNVENNATRTAGDQRIYACGLRNVWEFAFDSSNRLWAAEAGDSCDEINNVKAGVNYGWRPPRTDCAGEGEGKPVLKIRGTASGIDTWNSKAAGNWMGDLFYCLYAKDGKLVRYDIKARKRFTISAAEGRCLLDLTGGPNGLYFSD
ncbi:MAG: PQQ-dependent sugar dehydrogenase, partial [Thermoleophilaceae bacterium]|nr:PQQ-dependent sugar dehydrogenase [Thermoleophilaceae bacterium]